MKKINKISLLIIISWLLGACVNAGHSLSSSENSATIETPSSYSHSDETAPDYDVVFPQASVNEILITISVENWESAQADMTANYGEFGSSSERGALGRMGDQDFRATPPGQNALQFNEMEGERPQPPLQDRAEGMATPPADLSAEDLPGEGSENFKEANAGQPQMDDARQPERGEGGMPGMGRMAEDDQENPIWVEATIEFNGETWEHVGFRFKGNSSLRSSWGSGSQKLPFKLDFDQFEENYEEISNQRFFGFKQLSFSSNFSDASYLREKIAADIFRQAGVPSAQTAFYAVSIDFSQGAQYVGLYTAVELVDDSLIQTQFSEAGGNVYKPSGSAATFVEGTFNEEQYDKETNQEDANYSDVQALLEVLHSETRQNDAEAWREQLESVFDVESFLQWLAVNSIMQNWDTYGSMAHNYYLYHDPQSDQLVWIPWDNNMALSSHQGGSRNPAGGDTSTSISHENLGDQWPLISFLLADEEYQQEYIDCVQDVIENVFLPEELEERLNELHELITPYVQTEQAQQSDTESTTQNAGRETFSSSLQALNEHIRTRYQAALDFLSENR